MGSLETDASMSDLADSPHETQRFPPRAPQLCVSLKSHLDASALGKAGYAEYGHSGIGAMQLREEGWRIIAPRMAGTWGM